MIAALASYDLKSIIFGADNDRLQKAVLLDRFCKIFDSFLVEIVARLIGIRLDQAELDLSEVRAGARFGCCLSHKGAESSPKSNFSHV